MQCSTRKVKKDGANHGRLFYACSKGKDDSCGYFEWKDTKEDEDPFEQFWSYDVFSYFNIKKGLARQILTPCQESIVKAIITSVDVICM